MIIPSGMSSLTQEMDTSGTDTSPPLITYVEIFRQCVLKGDYMTINKLHCLSKEIKQELKSKCAGIFQNLQKEGMDLSIEKQSAIRWAAKQNHYDVLRILLNDDKVDATHLRIGENIPFLTTAIVTGDLDAIRLILKHKEFQISTQSILQAIRARQPVVANLLWDNVKIQSEIDLLEIIESAHQSTETKEILDKSFHLLHEKLSTIMRNDYLSLLKKAMEKNSVALKDVIQSDLFNSDNYKLTFKWACCNNRQDIIEFLATNKSSSLDAYNHSLQWVCKKGYAEVLAYLKFHQRGDPTACDLNAFKEASHYGHVDILKQLLEDERVKPHLGNALSILAGDGHIEIVKSLLQDSNFEPDWRAKFVFIKIREKLEEPSTDASSREKYIEIIKLLFHDKRFSSEVYWTISWALKTKITHQSKYDALLCKNEEKDLQRIISDCDTIIDSILQDETIDKNEFKVQAIKNHDLELFRLLQDDPKIPNLENVENFLSQDERKICV